MSTIWEKIQEFWAAYGAYIGVAVIPTIITGLTLSSKTAGAAPTVQKIWDGLKQAMDFLSIVTHKDKMGTFKLPLTTSIKKDEKVKDELGVEVVKADDPKALDPTKVVPPVATGLVLILALGLVPTQSGCAWFSSTGGEVKDVTIDCATEAMIKNAGALMNTMIGLLTGAGGSWKEQVSALGKQFGKDTVACAAKLALEKIEDGVQSEADPEQLKATAEARVRVLQIDEKWKFAE